MQSYAVDNNDVYPAAASDAAAEVVPWPNNPFAAANTPMADSAAVGDYSYATQNGGSTFTLDGHMSNGDFSVP